jgi:uncharacterized protein YbbC (DUF1343 family)
MRFAGNRIFVALASVVIAVNARGAVELGIDVLESNGYALLKNKRGGLITNQTGVDSRGVRTRVLLRKNWTPDVVRFKGERSQYLIY